MTTFVALADNYAAMLAAAKLTEPTRVTATRLLQHRDRFLSLQQSTGVPALWVMPVFEREEPSFECYLGNGDPLNEPTKHVPRGRGPFASWEAGAADALKLDHISAVEDWSWARACYEWELWNGFGPRDHGRTSGYVWAGTDQYHGGKYVADGVWSPRTWDHQLGCFAIAKAIAELDPALGEGLKA